MHALALSSFQHDTAAAVFEDGVIKAAIEEDKLVRSRSTGLPLQAIDFCLKSAGVGWRDLDAVAVATDPRRGWRNRALLPARLRSFSPQNAILHEASKAGIFSRELGYLRRLRADADPGQKVFTFDHHLCHAASAFFLSPFDRALILTMDEEGDGVSGTISIGEDTQIRTLETIPFPHSLAWAYSQITELLGFAPHKEEHKTQWLSLEGEPVCKDAFLELLRGERSGLPHLNRGCVQLTGGLNFSDKFLRRIGLRKNDRLSDDLRRGLASSLQEACAEIVGALAERYCRQHGVQQLCLAGGLFQNGLLVANLEKRFGVNQVFVPPAPGNAGSALGAGALLWHQVMKRPRLPAVHCIYGGPTCDRFEIKDVLDNCKARYSHQATTERKLDATLDLLHSGKIVGWFQGAAEFGPRALGNRSLLASPWAAYVKENLNDYIKHREWFRPFAVAVPEEDCDRYFEASQLCQSMNSLARVKIGSAILPEGFVLPGDLVRLQVVRPQDNPLLWRLLKRFGEQAPAPLLVNTSFNLFGEPLVVRPRDAVRSYFCSGIDALVIDNFVLSKTPVKMISSAVSFARAS